MEKEPVQIRLKKLEWKLNILIGVALVQAVLMTIIVIGYFMPSTFTIVVFCLLLGLLIAVFYRQIPGWFGSFSRYVFAMLLNAQKTNSIKDLK